MIDRDTPLKLLVIRRDNIGDLVCTTPLFAALRRHFPNAHIAALVNTYNRPVLEGHPDVDAIYAYAKAKHRVRGSALAVHWRNLRLLWQLRRERFDYAFLAGSGFLAHAYRYARLVKPKHVIGYVEPGSRAAGQIDIGIPWDAARSGHEVENVCRILAPLGVTGLPPSLRVIPDADAVQRVQIALRSHGLSSAPIAVHISARKPSNRWPAERFVELMRRIHAVDKVGFMLFWSPGDPDNPRHPGDDAMAEYVEANLKDVPVVRYATSQLIDLVAGLSVCERLICSDGGAMHVAAGLGKPILCFFGDSGAKRWHPWGVPYVLLQPPSRDAADVSVDEAVAGFQQLRRKTTRSDDQASVEQS